MGKVEPSSRRNVEIEMLVISYTPKCYNAQGYVKENTPRYIYDTFSTIENWWPDSLIVYDFDLRVKEVQT